MKYKKFRVQFIFNPLKNNELKTKDISEQAQMWLLAGLMAYFRQQPDGRVTALGMQSFSYLTVTFFCLFCSFFGRLFSQKMTGLVGREIIFIAEDTTVYTPVF